MTVTNPIGKSYFAFGCRYTECQYEWVGELLKVYPETQKDTHIRENWIEQFYEIKGFNKEFSDKDEFALSMIGQRYAGVFLASCGFNMPTDDGHYSNKGDLFDLFMENTGAITYPHLAPLKDLSILDNTGLIFDIKTRSYNGTYPLNPESGVVGRVKKDGNSYSFPWNAFLSKDVLKSQNPPYAYIFCQIIEEDGQQLPMYMGWLTHEDVVTYVNNGKQVTKDKYYSFDLSELRSIDNLLHTLFYVQKNNKIPNLGPIVAPKLQNPSAGPISYTPRTSTAAISGSKAVAYSNTEEEVFGPSAEDASWRTLTSSMS
jgi:hypothetical protein